LVAGCLLLAGALSGCSGSVGETLGVGRRAPDEFQVVRRAPLVLPPDYALRPPQPGAEPSQQQDTSAQAQALLTGRPRPAAGPTAQSASELALLDQSQVRSDPDIREILVAENQDLVNLDEGRFLFILSWQRRRMEQRQEPVIDPVAESQRLAAGEAAGGVVTMRTGSEPIAP
jgi:hypothetical protein